MGHWRELYSEGLLDLCLSSSFRVMKWTLIRWAVYVARIGEKISVYIILMGKHKDKGPL